MQDIYFESGDIVELDIPYVPFANGVYLVELLAHVTGRSFDLWEEEVAFAVVRFDPFQTNSTFAATPEKGSVVPQHRWTAVSPAP